MIDIKIGQHYISNKDRYNSPHTVLVVLGLNEQKDAWILSAEVAGNAPQTLHVGINDLMEHLEKHWKLIFDPSDSKVLVGKRNRLEEVE